MPEIGKTDQISRLFDEAKEFCYIHRHEFITPEHFMYLLTEDTLFYKTLESFCDAETLKERLKRDILEYEQVPEDIQNFEPEPSELCFEIINNACFHVINSNAGKIGIPHLVVSIIECEMSNAGMLLKVMLDDNLVDFIQELIAVYECEEFESEIMNEEEPVDPLLYTEDKWRSLVTCLNDNIHSRLPLIGREEEIERTIQVLCRKDKNNPLHVGEPGVGKTALVYGLTARIVKGDVPDCLKNARVYLFDIGSMIAGTQFRGDFERRIKMVMDGVQEEGNGIVYIDEIHNLVGAGKTGDGSMDASNMLKPYLENGSIRFIGSTTYEEYNRFFSKSQGLVRRFLQIDINEPSIEETINIINGVKDSYEKFHSVVYTPEAIEYAVRQSAKYINDRFLPDKAIDIIDEAGAATKTQKRKTVPTSITKHHIEDILHKVCKIDAVALKDENNENLAHLQKHILDKIYGQNEAVCRVVEAIQMSKAGLADDNKPLASLLFVGPTGVGKTEVARVLAQELGVQLIRFDMSEYTEKHAVAKLIGSPAGYVGYEDGGLLTDAIRKTPNCVLLLDEIEKAHPDIYNILLQVMDYASLTDNRGKKADFRNVVLIMTSNAGAQYAGQRIGFEPSQSRGEAMMKQVKRIFKPEFINRLTSIVVFNDMDEHMAELILKKKLRELKTKLSVRNVVMHLTDGARKHLLQKGFTQEYGAREMDRVISKTLKPLLMQEILFGKLKNGGEITITLADIKASENKK